MHWIYILGCYDENYKLQQYYVGETNRLYRRLWEHEEGRCLNTQGYETEIFGIYKMKPLSYFELYDSQVSAVKNGDLPQSSLYHGFNNPSYLLNNWNVVTKCDGTKNEDTSTMETFVADCLRKYTNVAVRGGKYTRFDEVNYTENDICLTLPKCNCGLPSDVAYKENSFYFRCSRKNIWEDISNNFCVHGEPCSFYKKYNHEFEVHKPFRTSRIPIDTECTLQSNTFVNTSHYSSDDINWLMGTTPNS